MAEEELCARLAQWKGLHDTDDDCCSECSSSGLVECSSDDEEGDADAFDGDGCVLIVGDKAAAAPAAKDVAVPCHNHKERAAARLRAGSYAASTDCSEHGDLDGELLDSLDEMAASWDEMTVAGGGGGAGVAKAVEDEEAASDAEFDEEGRQMASLSQPITINWAYCDV